MGAPRIIGATAMASHAESVTTDPVGFVKLQLEPGLQTVGAAMVKPAVVAGRVDSNSNSSITLENEIGALDANGAYYVEVRGPKGAAEGDDVWVGDRFEVDVAGSSGSTIAINTASSRNTVSLSAADLEGYSVVVRPHHTLAELFPPAQLTPGDLETGDQVLFWNRGNSTFEIHTLEEGVEFLGIPDAWRRGEEVTDGRVIAPGEGFFVRRRGGPVSLLTNIGEVRMNDFRQPLGLGLTLIAEGHPVNSSPESRMMTGSNGMQPGDLDTGDQILLFNTSANVYEIYTYEEGVEFLGIPDAWRRGESSYDTAELFQADKSVFFRKRGSAESDYVAPRTFPN